MVAVVGVSRVSSHLSLVADLLQFMPANISLEITYNRREAMLHPHCCVCSLFVAVFDQSLLSLALL